MSTTVRRNPDDLTAHFASGGSVASDFVAWVEANLEELRCSEPGAYGGDEPPLVHLRRVYMGARILQGGVVASRLALPAMIGAGEQIRSARLPDSLRFEGPAAVQTEAFLTGNRDGRPRDGNDYPAEIKAYISALAHLLQDSYGQAYDELEATRPDLLTLGWHADELQRIAWGHMRSLIEEVLPADEVAEYRKLPLREGSDELMTVLTQRTGLRFPARVMQRDDWRDAIRNPRQDPKVALFNATKFFVENAEIGLSYCLGSLLVRAHLSGSAEAVLAGHVRHAPQDIAFGTRLVTHRARFQSRVGARPNDYRSFRVFLRMVREQALGAALGEDGAIAWAGEDARFERGWCPAQNKFEPRDDGFAADLTARGRAEMQIWREHGRANFGVVPVFSKPSAAELFGCVVVFATIHRGSPLALDSPLIEDLVARSRGAATDDLL